MEGRRPEVTTGYQYQDALEILSGACPSLVPTLTFQVGVMSCRAGNTQRVEKVTVV